MPISPLSEEKLKACWDQLSLAEKKLLGTAAREDFDPEIVPLRSWNVEKLIDHARTEASCVEKKLTKILSPTEKKEVQGMIDEVCMAHAQLVFLHSLELLPTFWIFSNIVGQVAIFGLVAIACVFPSPVDSVLMTVSGVVLTVCGGFNAIALRRFIQITGDTNNHFRRIARTMSFMAVWGVVCCLAAAVLLGMAEQIATTVP